MPISNYPNGFSGGVAVQGLPLLNTYGGEVFWVSSTGGSNGNRGTFDRPFATIQKGIDACTASRGDIVMVKPFHAETVTAQIDLDVIGVSVVGLGGTTSMPTITVNGTIDGIDMSAANCSVSNIRFAAPGTDTQTADINVDAAGCSVIGTYHIGSTTSKNKVSIITLTANADDALIDGVRIYNDVVALTGGGIALEGACSRVEIRNCFIWDSIGLDLGAVFDGATALAVYIHHNVFKNAKAATVVLEFGNNSTGICSFNHVSGRHTTIASNVAAGTGMDFFENRVTEEAALNGMIMPAADSD